MSCCDIRDVVLAVREWRNIIEVMLLVVVIGETSRATRTIIRENMIAWQATDIKIRMSEWWIPPYNDLNHDTPEYNCPIWPAHVVEY